MPGCCELLKWFSIFLGKIILANFATPKGLRQIGDSSLETSESGAANVGEPGSAGFGTIRAGAMERSNVDLTAELST